jgi:NADPH:quinone reductase-like Zn-dependent oxidoreductase
MKAAVYRSYGPPEVLKIEDVEKPSIQQGQEDAVLIRVHSASINPFDYYFRNGFLPARPGNGYLKPRQQILGIDVAGTVEAVGESVSRFKPGDRVFGSCRGSHAEYVITREGKITLMPENLTFDEAAAVPCAALTALQALKDMAEIKKGDRILINGASGGIGHFAVQLARLFEAEVTAVCSTSNLGWVKELGPQHVIDYTRENFAKNSRCYDLILDASAARTFFSCKNSLTDTGLYITENPTKPGLQLVQVLLSSLIGNKKMRVAGLTRTGGENLELIRSLLEAGKIRPVVERTYPLSQISAAHRHVENGHTKGKVVVQVDTG